MAPRDQALDFLVNADLQGLPDEARQRAATLLRDAHAVASGGTPEVEPFYGWVTD